MPGVLTEVVNLLMLKAESMEKVEKNCALFVEAMEIAEGYELHHSADIVWRDNSALKTS